MSGGAEMSFDGAGLDRNLNVSDFGGTTGRIGDVPGAAEMFFLRKCRENL